MNELKHKSSWGRSALSADWLLIAIPGLIWGASFLFIAGGLKAMRPSGITFVRLFIGFATLAMFPAARKLVERAAWPRIALVGVFWFAFPLSMFPFAEQRVSSALTGMLNAAVPLFTAIVASTIARRIPERRVIAGVAIGLMGAGLIAWPAIHEGHRSVFGVLLILAAVVSYGFALNFARPPPARVRSPSGDPPRTNCGSNIDRTARRARRARGALDTGALFLITDVRSTWDWCRIRVAGRSRWKIWSYARIVRSVLDTRGRAPARNVRRQAPARS